ncbi:MAG: MATE family efflux transporter [Pseudomonadota bacterium]
MSQGNKSAPERGKFTTGSTMRHVVVMTMTSSVGLVAIFLVDALNLFYISLLGEKELAAAIGFAGTLQFFLISTAIGMTIGAGALVSRNLGAGDREEAARDGGTALLLIAVIISVLVALFWFNSRPLLSLLGARDETLEIAVHFLNIVLPSTTVMAIGMGASGILRGVGDAKRAMYVTLSAGAVSAVVDPILIFGFDLGVTGAAISTVISRCVLCVIGLHGAAIVHGLVAVPDAATVRRLFNPFFLIAGPAIMTQLATPIGNAYVTAQIATYGDDAVAAWAVISRTVPVAFGVIFALSGAVGPILGQNYGAQLYDRLRNTMRDALTFTLGYVLVVCIILFLAAGSIADVFQAEGEARELIVFFCRFVAISFLFNGALFVANAAFNNLGFALYSTAFNWGRSTLGIIPFVWLGGEWFGAKGIIAGWGLGVVVFGLAAVVVCFRVIGQIENRPHEPGAPTTPVDPATPANALSSGKTAGLG